MQLAMEQLLTNSAYSKNTLLEEKKILISAWKSESMQASEEEYRADFLTYVACVEKHKPLGVLGDTRDHAFKITPALQKWLNETMFPRVLAAGAKHFAFLVAKDFFSQLSIEQVMGEDVGALFNSRYFITKAEAMEWLEEQIEL